VLWCVGVGALVAVFAGALPNLVKTTGSRTGITILDTVHVAFEVAAWVRDAPASAGGKVAILGSNTSVSVACVVQGEEIIVGGKSTDLWAYLWKPVVGYISDALLQTSSRGPAVPRCSDPPLPPPAPLPSLGKLVELNGDITAVRARPSPLSDQVIGLEAGSSVMVDCRASGEEVSRDGMASAVWARTSQPFSGFVSELFVAAELNDLPPC